MGPRLPTLGCPHWAPINACSSHPCTQAGTPLGDGDRWPWLQQLAGIIQSHVRSGRRAVLSCSALKPGYRRLLRTGARGGGSSGSGSDSGGGGQAAAGAAGEAEAGKAAAEEAGPGDGGDGDSSSVTFVSVCALRYTGLPRSRCHAAPAATLHTLPLPMQVLLDPPRHLLERRLVQRAAAGGHFTPGAALLDSQLAALLYHERELLLHVRGDPFPPPEAIAEQVVQRLGILGQGIECG